MNRELECARDKNELSRIEIKCLIGAHKDLGKATVSAVENKQKFVYFLEN